MIGTLNQNIGARLRYVRETAGVSYEEMAKLLQVTVPHYRKIERGLYELNMDKLVTLYEKLGADPLFLLTGESHTPMEVDASLPVTNRRELRVMQDLFRYCRAASEPDMGIKVRRIGTN